MNFEDFWQENKRFLSIVFGCVVTFFIAKAIIKGTYADQAAAIAKGTARAERELRDPRYDSSDEKLAKDINAELGATVAEELLARGAGEILEAVYGEA